jgi:hypothetical protein
MTYNSNNNSVYAIYSVTPSIEVLDCSTNTISASIVLPNNAGALSQVTPSNEIYFFDNVTGLLQKINCSTNTLVLINLALPNIVSNVNSINYNNGYLYITSSTSNIIDIVNANTNTYFSSITIPAINNFQPNYTGINTSTNQLFITDSNATNPKQYAVIDFATNSLVSVNSIGGVGATYGVLYNSLTNTMYISGSLYSVVTFTATPFFIGGSTNYNSFVNSLGYQPIEVQMIRFVSQNQTQLYNQVQFSRIDANGNQIFFSEFPILKVDAYQEQGNIAELKLDGLVFDGNTYINNYIINPSQVVSFEIIYKQLDRFSESPSYPIFFKHKVQLKEYIKQDYSDYDVEI